MLRQPSWKTIGGCFFLPDEKVTGWNCVTNQSGTFQKQSLNEGINSKNEE